MVVVLDGTPLGMVSFSFVVFDLARHYGALPGVDWWLGQQMRAVRRGSR